MSDSLEPARKLLCMVALLHRRGYESLRVLAYMAPSGAYWRCEIGPACRDGSAPFGVGEPRVRYSNSEEANYYGWGDCRSLTNEELADRFEESFPELLVQARPPNAAYREWFAEMLVKTAPGGLIYAFADWQTEPGVMHVLGKFPVDSLPLPPQ